MAFLLEPMDYPGQLAGLHYPALNGSMWTIAYEFRCYLFVAALGISGLLLRPRVILALTVLGIAGNILFTFASISGPVDAFAASHHGLSWLIGIPSFTVQLTSVFLVGVAFYVLRDRLFERLTPLIAATCAILCMVLMFHSPHLADAAAATFGAVALFWLAFRANIGPFQRVNDNWDISYGVYLYGWPIAIFILWTYPGISPWPLAAITLPLAFVFGTISWFGVEKWTKDLKRSRCASSPE